MRVALSGLTMAEYFRDEMQQDVLLFIDNIFRYVQAGNEVSAMRVGMLLGSSRNGNFDAYAKRLRVIYAPMYYKSTEELTEALQNGEIDAIVTSNLRQLQGEWLLAQFDQQPFYAIVRKEDTTLLAELDYAIEQLHTTHPDFEDSLFRRYYSPQSGDQIAYTAEERAFIRSCQENGTVFEAILNPDRRPYSYLEDGEMKGILADVCREIFNRTGLTIHFRTAADRVEYQTMRREGAAAICCDCSTSFSAAENAGYVLTSPYFDSSIARVTRRDFTGSVKTAGMRTPMNGILGLVTLSRDEQSPQVLRENIRKIGEAGNYLLGLINDTLDLSKLESKKLELKPTPFHASEFMDSLNDMLRPSLEEKDITFEIVNHGVRLDVYPLADELRLRQVFMKMFL